MKNIFLLSLLLIISLAASAQEDKTKDAFFDKIESNIFVDIDGAANNDFKWGGPNIIVGCQLNHHVFAGVGGGIKIGRLKNIDYKDDEFFDPEWGWLNGGMGSGDFITNFRFFALENSRWNPYLDLRYVLNLTYQNGYVYYTSFALGNRFALRRGDSAFNLSAGYTLMKFQRPGYGFSGAFTIRVGIEI